MTKHFTKEIINSQETCRKLKKIINYQRKGYLHRYTKENTLRFHSHGYQDIHSLSFKFSFKPSDYVKLQ